MNFNTPDITPGDRSDTVWRQINEARDAARYLDRRRGPMHDAIAELRHPRNRGTNGMHPFKVYAASLALGRKNFVDPKTGENNSWLNFLVRGGRVCDRILYGQGSDGYDTDPWSDRFSATDGQGKNVVPIVVPRDVGLYYIWIEVLVDGTPKLRYGDDPTDDSDGTNPSVTQWTKWPDMDGIHFAVAEINPTKPHVCGVRQIACCDFIYKFREVTDCVAGMTVYRQAIVSDWYPTPRGNTFHTT